MIVLNLQLAIDLFDVGDRSIASWLIKADDRFLIREGLDHELLSACPLPVAGDEGYRTAEVTGGGVPLGALVTRTLEARAVPGLHFAGEVVDVTGRMGGFNFLWAWVSGRLVGRAVASAHSSSAPSM
jgi:hypothetical protein